MSSAVSRIGRGGTYTGTVTVADNGSKWTNSSDVYVGYYGSGHGVLNIQAGGQVSNVNGWIGNGYWMDNTVTVSGVGSKWINSGDLRFDQTGNQKLTVSDGGEVTATTIYASLTDLFGNGTITVQARCWMLILYSIARTACNKQLLLEREAC